MIAKLKDFLSYLEDKNLINSKIKDSKKLNQIVESLINSNDVLQKEIKDKKKKHDHSKWLIILAVCDSTNLCDLN